jgi:hypothetical protein
MLLQDFINKIEKFICCHTTNKITEEETKIYNEIHIKMIPKYNKHDKKRIPI